MLVRLLCGLLLSGSLAWGGDHRTPLERNGFARVTSHQELLDFLVSEVAGSRTLRLDTVGFTVQGRPIPLVTMSLDGMSPGRLRVFVFCQQHGNEPSGKEAALALVARAARGELDPLLQTMDLLLMPSVNPDGNEGGKRQNGAGADLNRDHLLLAQPETRAVHAVFARWMPEVTLDVHEFFPYGRAWLTAGYVRSMDEQFGAPTNPNVARSLVRIGVEKMFPALDRELRDAGFRFFNYIIVGSPTDTLRHSTTSINDGRQSLAILNTYAFILEGKNGPALHDSLGRRSRGQLAAILSFLRFAAENAATLRTLVARERAALSLTREPVALLNDHLYDGADLDVPVRTVSGEIDSVIRMPHRPTVHVLRSTERPKAYIISGAETSIIELLQRHGVRMEVLSEPKTFSVEALTVTGWSSRIIEEDSVLIPELTTRREEHTCVAGDVLVPLDQLHSTMIAIALEPASMWGVISYDAFRELREPGKEYPVYRVIGEP